VVFLNNIKINMPSLYTFVVTSAFLFSTADGFNSQVTSHDPSLSVSSRTYPVAEPISLEKLLKLEAAYQNSGIAQTIDRENKAKVGKVSKKKLPDDNKLEILSNPIKRIKMHRPVSQYSRVERKTMKTTPCSTDDVVDSSNGLTREEEIQYSFQLRTFRAAVQLRDSLVQQDVNGVYVHPTEAQWAYACGTSIRELRRIMDEGQEARLALVAANIGLVTSQAKKYFHATKQSMTGGNGVGSIQTLQDLIQEGNLGLMTAAERYRPEKGFRFSTYATWWIRQRISKSVAETSRTIRLPAYVHGMLQKIRKAKTEVQSATGKEATMQDISQFLEVPVDKLEQSLKSNYNVISLESPLRTQSFKQDSRTLGDTIAVEGPAPYEDMEAEYLRRDIRAVMDNTLSEQEREVIIQRFGLEDQKQRTVTETARYLGLSKKYVRLVEVRALNKLRDPQRNHLLKDYAASNESCNVPSIGIDVESKKKSDRGIPYPSLPGIKFQVTKKDFVKDFVNVFGRTKELISSPREDKIWLF
jgi:RNA polymerase sigma factor (sigma-70 family)